MTQDHPARCTNDNLVAGRYLQQNVTTHCPDCFQGWIVCQADDGYYAA